jgi:hypothetical protein
MTHMCGEQVNLSVPYTPQRQYIFLCRKRQRQ